MSSPFRSVLILSIAFNMNPDHTGYFAPGQALRSMEMEVCRTLTPGGEPSQDSGQNWRIAPK
jgi:hypothetical protein